MRQKDKRTRLPPPFFDKPSDSVDYPKGRELTPTPNPSPREGSVDGWGKNGLSDRVLRFANLSLSSCCC